MKLKNLNALITNALTFNGTTGTSTIQYTGSGQTVSTKLTGLKVGELYYVAVTAVSKNGKESECSAAASARARGLQ